MFPSPQRPRIIAALGLAGAVAGALVLHALGPRPPAWYPPCVFHAVTGLHCPGCGSGRAVHALAQGDIAAACGQNIWLLALLPFLAAWFAGSVWRGLRHNRPLLSPPPGAARAVLVVTLVFAVARNLPWWPLTVLAPDPLPPAATAQQQPTGP